jgi:hypothetical protein
VVASTPRSPARSTTPRSSETIAAARSPALEVSSSAERVHNAIGRPFGTPPDDSTVARIAAGSPAAGSSVAGTDQRYIATSSGTTDSGGRRSSARPNSGRVMCRAAL